MGVVGEETGRAKGSGKAGHPGGCALVFLGCGGHPCLHFASWCSSMCPMHLLSFPMLGRGRYIFWVSPSYTIKARLFRRINSICKWHWSALLKNVSLSQWKSLRNGLLFGKFLLFLEFRFAASLVMQVTQMMPEARAPGSGFTAAVAGSQGH